MDNEGEWHEISPEDGSLILMAMRNQAAMFERLRAVAQAAHDVRASCWTGSAWVIADEASEYRLFAALDALQPGDLGREK